jgi:hypothetical protein
VVQIRVENQVLGEGKGRFHQSLKLMVLGFIC